MNVTTIARGAETLCSLCGDRSVAAVCHHCGRPLCTGHGKPEKDGGRVLTEEFTGLGLQGAASGEAPVHCESCRHVLRRPPWGLLAGCGVAIVFGRLMQQELPAEGLTIALLGVVGAVLMGRMVWLRLRAISANAPPVPTSPRFSAIEATERVRGTILMAADGSWSSTISERAGQLSVRATFAEPDRRVLRAYLKKFRPTVRPGELRLCAGFLLLRDRLSAEIASTRESAGGASMVIPVSGSVGDVPFLVDEAGHGDRTWQAQWDYRLLTDEAREVARSIPGGDGTPFPVRVVPSLVPNSDGRVLELDLAWAPTAECGPPDPEGRGRPGVGGAPHAALGRPRLEELAIDAPLQWGEVESLSGGGLAAVAPSTTGSFGPLRRISWCNLPLQSASSEQSIARLRLRFRNRIDPAGEVKGAVTLEFSGGFSGLRTIDVFDPLGGPRAADQGQVRTRIEATFHLYLDILRHREHLVASGYGDEDVARVEGLAPSYELALGLARVLRPASFHIHRVEEEPPRVGSEAGRTKRLWDLSGQYRSGLDVFPVHALVSGEDGMGTGGGGVPFTEVSITLRGTVGDESSQLRLEQAVRTLRDTVLELMADCRKGVSSDQVRATAESSPGSPEGSSADLDPSRQN